MSEREEVVCSSCTVMVPQVVEVAKIYYKGREVSLESFQDMAAQRGVKRVEVPRKSTKFQGALSGFEVKISDAEIEVEAEKRFDGTWEQALLANWTENEFGRVCPTCGAAEEEEEGVEHGNLSMTNPLIALAAAAIKQDHDRWLKTVLNDDARNGDGTVDSDEILDNLEALPSAEQIQAAAVVVETLDSLCQNSDNPQVTTALRQTIEVIRYWAENPQEST
jgi:hypothetical protein